MSDELHGTPMTSSPRDYRDDLKDLIHNSKRKGGPTAYRLCKTIGMDNGTLSNVLAKRRNFSLEKLEKILDVLGHQIAIVPKPAPTTEV